MNEWMQANVVLVAAALVVAVLVAVWLVLANRRTRIDLTPRDEGGPARRNQALIDAAPAAQGLDAPVVVAATTGDLARIKGLGPRLQAQLANLGVTSLAQVAAWDEAEIDRIDAQLGRFSGRIRRDAWVAQARLLAAGDEAGYAAQFGNL